MSLNFERAAGRGWDTSTSSRIWTAPFLCTYSPSAKKVVSYLLLMAKVWGWNVTLVMIWYLTLDNSLLSWIIDVRMVTLTFIW